MKTYTLNEVQNQLIGEIGTPERDAFEYELQMELIGKAIKQTRLDCQLTQEELGKITGVQREQISKLEKTPGNVTVQTFLRVVAALKAKFTLQIELPDHTNIILER